MLSNDKNVETIAQLIEVLKHYVGLQAEYVKLDVIEKVVRLLTATALAVVFFLILVAAVMYISFASAFWIGQHIGMAPAFVIVGFFHLILFLVFFLFRKPWIEKPLVKFLANLLMSK